jgi:subtilisin family serine protease
VTHRWEAISAVAGEVSLRGLTKLLADPDVRRVDLDVGGSGDLDKSVPLIQADQVQALGCTGRGVTVAVLDSGIDTDRPDLRDDILAEHYFCANEGGRHIRAI